MHTRILTRAWQMCGRRIRSSVAVPDIISAGSARIQSTRMSSSQMTDQSAAMADPTRLRYPDRLYKMIELEMRAHDRAVLDSYVWFLQRAAHHLQLQLGRVYEPPKHFHRFSVLKAAHSKGKHKVQYEMRTYFRVLEVLRLTGSTADTYLEYIQRMLPEGVAMKVTRHDRQPLPSHLRQIPKR